VAAIAAVFAAAAIAQPVDEASATSGSGAPQPVLLAPVFEGDVRKNRGINIPGNLRFASERRISLGYTATNSYLNPGSLVCRDRSCELEYESDHTGNLLFVGYTQPLLNRFEIGLSAGLYQMRDIPRFSPVHLLASDRTLRRFHQEILREDSLPVLSNAPDGRQLFTMMDLDGRRLQLVPEHRYSLPLRVDLTRYFDIRQTDRVRMGLNAGIHFSYPLEGDVNASAGATAFSRGMDFGLSANFIRSRRLTPNLSSTIHIQIARFRSNVHVVNPNSPLPGDDTLRGQYALTYGLRFDRTFRGRAPCSLAMSHFTNSAHFDKRRYWAVDPLLEEGGSKLRGAIAGANDYGALSFACEFRDREYQLTLVEDITGLSELIYDDGSGTSYDPDLAVGVAVTLNLGSRRGAAQ
jgi:hypothetical protein